MKKKYISILLVLTILLVIGAWNIKNGNIAFGASLIGASLGVGVIRFIKERRIAELQAKGLDPHDERAVHIAGLASILTLNITIFAIAIIILLGSVLGPEIMVNPYEILGFCLAGIVLLYIITFYYYNRRN